MIAFIFEGKRTDPNLFERMLPAFFSDRKDCYTCFYGNNIYNLYSRIKELGDGADIINVLKHTHPTPAQCDVDSLTYDEFAQIYLFFDFDFHDSNYEEENKRHILGEMLEYFNDETENGKLFIHYPMVEAINFTKELPDTEFINYKVTLEESHDFKRHCDSFSFYKGMHHICGQRRDIKEIEEFWKYLCRMHYDKGEAITGKTSPFSQKTILNKQLEELYHRGSFYVLSAFPMFLIDYFPTKRLLS